MLENRLQPYRRHLEGCDYSGKGQNFTLCGCPIWAYGRLKGEPWRRSLHTNDWDRASMIVQALLRGDDLLPVAPDGPSVKTACADYLRDCKRRNLAESTIRSYTKTLEHLEKFAGTRPISSFDQEAVKSFCGSREIKPKTARKEIECLRAFCGYCVDQDWLNANPAKKVKPPKADYVSTLPYTDEEVRKLLDACDRMRGMWTEDTPFVRQRARALVLVLLYSGLRVSDVAALRRGALESTGHLVLRTTKTGVPVKVLLHPDAAKALQDLPAPAGNPTYFFWSGHGDPDDCSKSLGRTIARVGKLAKVHAHPHRFRDTFAVELLTNGADIRTVQMLLGHKSVKTTEKYYGHFVKAHQDLLDAATARLPTFSKKTGRPLLVRPLKNRRRNA